MSFVARYADECGFCNMGIQPGDTAQYLGDTLVHQHCPTVRQPCSRCFMVPAASGACGCAE